jgi:hypothetical protein
MALLAAACPVAGLPGWQAYTYPPNPGLYLGLSSLLNFSLNHAVRWWRGRGCSSSEREGEREKVVRKREVKKV